MGGCLPSLPLNRKISYTEDSVNLSGSLFVRSEVIPLTDLASVDVQTILRPGTFFRRPRQESIVAVTRLTGPAYELRVRPDLAEEAAQGLTARMNPRTESEAPTPEVEVAPTPTPEEAVAEPVAEAIEIIIPQAVAVSSGPSMLLWVRMFFFLVLALTGLAMMLNVEKTTSSSSVASGRTTPSLTLSGNTTTNLFPGVYDIPIIKPEAAINTNVAIEPAAANDKEEMPVMDARMPTIVPRFPANVTDKAINITIKTNTADKVSVVLSSSVSIVTEAAPLLLLPGPFKVPALAFPTLLTPTQEFATPLLAVSTFGFMALTEGFPWSGPTQLLLGAPEDTYAHAAYVPVGHKESETLLDVTNPSIELTLPVPAAAFAPKQKKPQVPRAPRFRVYTDLTPTQSSTKGEMPVQQTEPAAEEAPAQEAPAQELSGVEELQAPELAQSGDAALSTTSSPATGNTTDAPLDANPPTSDDSPAETHTHPAAAAPIQLPTADELGFDSLAVSKYDGLSYFQLLRSMAMAWLFLIVAHEVARLFQGSMGVDNLCSIAQVLCLVFLNYSAVEMVCESWTHMLIKMVLVACILVSSGLQTCFIVGAWCERATERIKMMHH